MIPMDFTGFANRKPLGSILEIPKKVQSVYSLTQHVWEGESEEQRLESKKHNRPRLDTLNEFLIDPVRNYLDRILEQVAEGKGQGFWLQAEFGVGKSHLLAVTSILAVGGASAWDKIKNREDEEGRGPGARLDSLWRKKIEKKRIFPVVFSLEGVGGEAALKLEDFILEEAQKTFALREGKPMAVYPEEHLAALFLRDHQRTFKDDLRGFLADKRLMRGLPAYQYDELIQALKKPESQKDAGRLLMAFYRHKNLAPQVPVERGQRLGRMVQDVLEAGYNGIFIAIDEMSEYLRRAVNHNAADEDCLLTLSNSLAQVQGKPIWIVVAAQAAHTNPQKIIAPDRLRSEFLEHKPERFRDIVVQRTRRIKDREEVKLYYSGYRNLIPWVKEAPAEEFESAFPFPPDALQVIRNISKQLTGTRSTISFLHAALLRAAEEKSCDLVPLWRVFDDLMQYKGTPSAATTGTVSIKSRFRDEVAALEAAQATLKRITDGHLARPQNRKRAERVLNTLFLHHIAGVAGLTKEQILDAVCDLKPGEDELEAQLNHYETILEEMRLKLRNQIRAQQGRYEFVPKETSQYDDLVNDAADRLKSDPQLLSLLMDRALAYSDDEGPSPFAGFVTEGESRFAQFKVERWHGQERVGRVTSVEKLTGEGGAFDLDTHTTEDDFLVIVCRRPMKEKEIENWLKKGRGADPRITVWAPAEPTDQERAELAGVLAHLKVAGDTPESKDGKTARREFKAQANRAYTALLGLYGRGIARTCRTSPTLSLVGGVEGAIATMAKEAMDTCYQSREIDFGNRKFDNLNALRLINGLIRSGKAVSEGDANWSAVENFAEKLGLVRPEAPKTLDTSDGKFCQAVRKKIEKQGAGLDVKTVYNWFTGYNPSDGTESAGLTRRMVDVYLLALAQQGAIRIRLRGDAWIDRTTMAVIEFKTDVLKSMQRIELPREPNGWEIFAPYLEIATGRADLGPKFDQAKADEALRAWWGDNWPRRTDLEDADLKIRSLFTTLGRSEKSPFDDLLVYWIQFAEEERTGDYHQEDAFDALCRSVLRVAGIEDAEKLTAEHLERFRTNCQGLRDLLGSFEKTSLLLTRAARMASAPIPERGSTAIKKAQQDVLKVMEKLDTLILNPDSVSTQLKPRFETLESAYTEAFLSGLIRLDSIQGRLEELCGAAAKSPELEALDDFAAELPEARRTADGCRRALASTPPRLRKKPEDRDRANKELAPEAKVKDLTGEDITFRRLDQECDARQEAQSAVSGVGRGALDKFAAFLKSPGVADRLKAAKSPSAELTETVEAATATEVAESLLTMPAKKRKDLAKLLKAILGKKRAKPVCLRGFTPRTETVWEETDIERVVGEFRAYLDGQWEPDVYLKIEK
jgi:hypothetical protein